MFKDWILHKYEVDYIYKKNILISQIMNILKFDEGNYYNNNRQLVPTKIKYMMWAAKVVKLHGV